MRTLLAVGGAGASMLIGTACSAAPLDQGTSDARIAIISPAAGSLSVNQGQGFQNANGTVQAKVGDRVMVSPDGSASIKYGDGCTLKLQPGAVATIAPLSPCASGSFAQDQSSYAGIVGIAFLLTAGVFATVYFVDHNNTAPPPAPASP